MRKRWRSVTDQAASSSLSRAWTGPARNRSSGTVALLGECESTLIDFAARPAGDGGDFRDRLFDRNTLERLTQQRVEINRLALGLGWCHHNHHLATRLARLRSLARQRGEIPASDLFVELGELAAERALPRAKAGSKVGERTGDARTGLEQHERCWNALELGDARAPCCFLCRQESLEEKAVGR